MQAAEAWIEKIIDSSGIPSAARRREILRELRSHIDDFVCNARRRGHSDAEIESMIEANLGDPLQMGRNFAWVYRRERAIFRLSVCAISTALVAVLVAGSALAVQAGLAAGFGHKLIVRHMVIEALDILTTVAAYVGLLTFEDLFRRRSLAKAIALLAYLRRWRRNLRPRPHRRSVPDLRIRQRIISTRRPDMHQTGAPALHRRSGVLRFIRRLIVGAIAGVPVFRCRKLARDGFGVSIDDASRHAR